MTSIGCGTGVTKAPLWNGGSGGAPAPYTPPADADHWWYTNDIAGNIDDPVTTINDRIGTNHMTGTSGVIKDVNGIRRVRGSSTGGGYVVGSAVAAGTSDACTILSVYSRSTTDLGAFFNVNASARGADILSSDPATNMSIRWGASGSSPSVSVFGTPAADLDVPIPIVILQQESASSSIIVGTNGARGNNTFKATIGLIRGIAGFAAASPIDFCEMMYIPRALTIEEINAWGNGRAAAIWGATWVDQP